MQIYRYIFHYNILIFYDIFLILLAKMLSLFKLCFAIINYPVWQVSINTLNELYNTLLNTKSYIWHKKNPTLTVFTKSRKSAIPWLQTVSCNCIQVSPFRSVVSADQVLVERIACRMSTAKSFGKISVQGIEIQNHHYVFTPTEWEIRQQV